MISFDILKQLDESIIIVNLHDRSPIQPNEIRVDRTSVFGNPYAMRSERERNHSCNLYQERFDRIMKNKEEPFYSSMLRLKEFYELHSKLYLFCWCAPKRCHAETIKEWLIQNAFKRGEENA